MTSPCVTCLVPTHNRPQFLRRLLAFYSKFPPIYPIVVVDSSKPEASVENRTTVTECQRELDVTYRHNDTDFLSKCIRALELVKTPFVALCADDDVLFPETVLQCAEFLSHNPSYSSALGRVALLRPSNPQWATQVLRGYSIEDDSPLERCRRLAEVFFTNFYAVYRTEILHENYRVTAQHTDASANSLLPEMLLGQLSVLRGRIKVIPAMYSLMESHSQNAGTRMKKEVRENPEMLFQRFKLGLADECEKTGIDRLEAEQFIDFTFGCFRDPDGSVRGRQKSILSKVAYLLNSVRERIEHRIRYEGNRHRRLLWSRDIKGIKRPWKAAVHEMRKYPLGIPHQPEDLAKTA